MKIFSQLLLLLLLASFAFSTTLKLLVLGDAHTDPGYYKGADQDHFCRKGKGKAGEYGSIKNCDIPYKTFESALQFGSTLDPDVVLYLGDMMPHQIDWTRDDFQNWFLNTTKTLKGTFPKVKKIYFTLGNNDFFSDNNAPPVSDFMYTNAANFWSPWLSTQSFQRVQNGGFYSELIPGTNIRVISMNSILWFEENQSVNSDYVDPWGQLNWIKETLEASYTSNEKVWFMSHLPLGMLSSTGRFWKKRFQTQFLQIIRKYMYSQNGEKMLTAMFSGHHHRDQFEIIYDKDVYPHDGSEKPLLVDFRISAIESRDSETNPSLRLIKFDTDSGFLLNYEQYFLDIVKANKDLALNWNLRYSAGEYGAYGLNGLGPEQFNNFLQSLKSSNDLVQEYWVNMSEGLVDTNCGSNCRTKLICKMEFITEDECTKCHTDQSY
ncbi:sphingomyelin phosphodiesterase [Anaeramoeba flamelloides]|uniref:Sphingomyelin phosphodiesterase n=1 Tax=Anaeramoeba flamelloides TaxID=1746091 RepID=A0AAV8ADR9_9EUKA|nr:sphingomyelin phosphodiesterase [Anaeramoeba flamelloides]